MRRLRWLLVAAGALASLTTARAETDITADDLRERVRWLADDAREGRGAGTPGLEESARYIEKAFKSWRLPPAGDGSGYRQVFEAAAGTPRVIGAELVVGRTTLRMGADFLPFALSDSGRVSGALAADSLRDRIAVLRPENSTPEVPAPTKSAAWGARFAGLKERGALGVLALVDSLPPVGAPGAEFTLTPGSKTPGGTTGPGTPAPAQRSRPFVAAMVTLDAWRRALGDSALQKLPETGAATLRVDIERTRMPLANLVARIAGTDTTLDASPVLLGAHYDHLGVAADGRTIMNGADDNASGVAVLLEIAEALSKEPRHARPIYLVAFSGEESGLLGSTHFTERLPFPAAGCIAMVNLDTVGRPGNGHLLVLGSSTSPDWPPLLESANPDSGLVPVCVPESYASSDQWPFARLGIPAVQFFGGPNADYHRPTDDADRIDYHALQLVARFTHAVVGELADRRAPLAPGTSARSQGDSVASGAPARSPATRAWLGTVPDFAYQGTGVRLTGVSTGSPAERAGLREGDVVTEMAGDPVESLADLTTVLKAHHAGEEVEVVFQRLGTTERVRLVLGTRP